MNTINFITPLSRKQRNALIIWALVSLISIIATATIIIYLHTNALNTWHALHKEKAFLDKQKPSFNALVEEKQQLTLQEKTLQQQQTFFANFTTYHQQLQSIFTTLGQQNQLNTLAELRIAPPIFEVTLKTKNPESANQLIAQLQELPFLTNLALTSLTIHDNDFQATIKGKIVA